MSQPNHNRYLVKSLVHASQILNAFTSKGEVLALKDHDDPQQERELLVMLIRPRKALQEANLPLCKEYIREGGYSTEGGYRAAMEILRLQTPPTAVFACNNRMTMGLMHALKNLGLKYPQDVSVFGFDDFDWSELFSPRLTTIVQPSYEMGIRATEMLLQLIEARNQHLEIPGGYRIVLKAELRIRDSTAPPGSVSALTQQPRPCSRRKNHRQEKANLFWMGKHCGRE